MKEVPFKDPAKHNAYCINRWQQIKRQMIEYKGGKCYICGYDRCQDALEFHHINHEDKDPNFRNIKRWGWPKIQKELDKCVLLCSCCHKEEHYILGQVAQLDRATHF